MRQKLLLAGALLIFPTALFAWPPMPKVISSGKGVYLQSGKEVQFQWVLGMSVAKNNNIYVDIATEIIEKDRSLIEENGMEVILYDNESTFIKVKINSSKLSSREISEKVMLKLNKACPNLIFNLSSALYGPRP